MIYNITIHIIKIIFSLFSLSNEKAKNVIKNHLKLIESNDINNVIWFHCASLGEYEQAVNVINEIKFDIADMKAKTNEFEAKFGALTTLDPGNKVGIDNNDNCSVAVPLQLIATLDSAIF